MSGSTGHRVSTKRTGPRSKKDREAKRQRRKNKNAENRARNADEVENSMSFPPLRT